MSTIIRYTGTTRRLRLGRYYNRDHKGVRVFVRSRRFISVRWSRPVVFLLRHSFHRARGHVAVLRRSRFSKRRPGCVLKRRSALFHFCSVTRTRCVRAHVHVLPPARTVDSAVRNSVYSARYATFVDKSSALNVTRARVCPGARVHRVATMYCVRGGTPAVASRARRVIIGPNNVYAADVITFDGSPVEFVVRSSAVFFRSSVRCHAFAATDLGGGCV